MDGAAVETLSGLLQRAHVLAAYRDGPAGRAEIAELADCSRSTVYRAEQYLDERGLVEDTPNGYRITGAGETVVAQFETCHAVVEGAMQLGPLLSHVDSPELDRHLHLLSDAELVVQEPSRPYHIEHRMRAVIADTEEEMVGMTAGLGSPTLAQTMVERIRAGVGVDWILPPATLEYFETQTDELAEDTFASERTRVSVLEELPMNLVIYDETLVVLGFDGDRGVLAVAAITDAPDAVSWARGVIDDCRGVAERVV